MLKNTTQLYTTKKPANSLILWLYRRLFYQVNPN